MAHTLVVIVTLAASIVSGQCDEKRPYDVIVVGLGSSGTSAASSLAAGGKHVLALEAQGYVGGRVRTVPFGDNIVEVGAEWIHGEHPNRVFEMAVERHLNVIRDDSVPKVYRSDGSLGDEALFTELANFCLNVEISGYVKNETLGNYITKRLTDHLRETKPEILNDEDLLHQFLEYMNLFMGASVASNDWNDVSVYTEWKQPKGHMHWSWNVLGYHTFFDILLNKYNNGPGLPSLEIKLNTEVTSISWSRNSNETVNVTTIDGTVYEGKRVIFTPSLGVLKAKHASIFNPPLPPNKVNAIENMSIGVVGKIILSFERAWWPMNTGFELIWKGEDLKKIPAEDYWTTRVYSIHAPMSNNNTLTLWTSGNVAKYVETLPEDVIKTQAMGLLRRFLGANITIPEPTAILRSTWFSNPFTRGSYSHDTVASIGGGNLRLVLAEPILDDAGQPLILFAGEATNHEQFSTVHGASDTGFREAARLLAVTS